MRGEELAHEPFELRILGEGGERGVLAAHAEQAAATKAAVVNRWTVPESAPDGCGARGTCLYPDVLIVRLNAAEALGAIGTEPKVIVPALRGALDDRDEQVRLKAIESLGEIGMASFECRILDAGGAELASATINVYRPEDPEAFLASQL